MKALGKINHLKKQKQKQKIEEKFNNTLSYSTYPIKGDRLNLYSASNGQKNQHQKEKKATKLNTRAPIHNTNKMKPAFWQRNIHNKTAAPSLCFLVHI